MAVAENARKSRAPAQSRNDFVRKTGNGAGKVAPVECDGDTGKFPMSRRRILSFGNLGRATTTALSPPHMKKRWHVPGRELASLRQPEANQVGNIQRTF